MGCLSPFTVLHGSFLCLLLELTCWSSGATPLSGPVGGRGAPLQLHPLIEITVQSSYQSALILVSALPCHPFFFNSIFYIAHCYIFFFNLVWEAVFYHAFEFISTMRYQPGSIIWTGIKVWVTAVPFCHGLWGTAACVPHRKQYGGHISQACMVSSLPCRAVWKETTCQ